MIFLKNYIAETNGESDGGHDEVKFGRPASPEGDVVILIARSHLATPTARLLVKLGCNRVAHLGR